MGSPTSNHPSNAIRSTSPVATGTPSSPPHTVAFTLSDRIQKLKEEVDEYSTDLASLREAYVWAEDQAGNYTYMLDALRRFSAIVAASAPHSHDSYNATAYNEFARIAANAYKAANGENDGGEAIRAKLFPDALTAWAQQAKEAFDFTMRRANWKFLCEAGILEVAQADVQQALEDLNESLGVLADELVQTTQAGALNNLVTDAWFSAGAATYDASEARDLWSAVIALTDRSSPLPSDPLMLSLTQVLLANEIAGHLELTVSAPHPASLTPKALKAVTYSVKCLRIVMSSLPKDLMLYDDLKLKRFTADMLEALEDPPLPRAYLLAHFGSGLHELTSDHRAELARVFKIGTSDVLIGAAGNSIDLRKAYINRLGGLFDCAIALLALLTLDENSWKDDPYTEAKAWLDLSSSVPQIFVAILKEFKQKDLLARVEGGIGVFAAALSVASGFVTLYSEGRKYYLGDAVSRVKVVAGAVQFGGGISQLFAKMIVGRIGPRWILAYEGVVPMSLTRLCLFGSTLNMVFYAAMAGEMVRSLYLEWRKTFLNSRATEAVVNSLLSELTRAGKDPITRDETTTYASRLGIHGHIQQLWSMMPMNSEDFFTWYARLQLRYNPGFGGSWMPDSVSVVDGGQLEELVLGPEPATILFFALRPLFALHDIDPSTPEAFETYTRRVEDTIETNFNTWSEPSPSTSLYTGYHDAWVAWRERERDHRTFCRARSAEVLAALGIPDDIIDDVLLQE